MGCALSAVLVEDGHQVNVLTRNPDKARNALPSGVTSFKWDGASLKGWSHLIEETDAVINHCQRERSRLSLYHQLPHNIPLLRPG